MGNIKIEKMVLGMVQTNTWFVINEKTKELILIDPADDAGRIIRKIEADGLKLQGILLTHGHFDHIGAVDDLRAYTVLCRREGRGSTGKWQLQSFCFLGCCSVDPCRPSAER